MGEAATAPRPSRAPRLAVAGLMVVIAGVSLGALAVAVVISAMDTGRPPAGHFFALLALSLCGVVGGFVVSIFGYVKAKREGRKTLPSVVGIVLGGATALVWPLVAAGSGLAMNY